MGRQKWVLLVWQDRAWSFIHVLYINKRNGGKGGWRWRWHVSLCFAVPTFNTVCRLQVSLLATYVHGVSDHGYVLVKSVHTHPIQSTLMTWVRRRSRTCRPRQQRDHGRGVACSSSVQLNVTMDAGDTSTQKKPWGRDADSYRHRLELRLELRRQIYGALLDMEDSCHSHEMSLMCPWSSMGCFDWTHPLGTSW